MCTTSTQTSATCALWKNTCLRFLKKNAPRHKKTVCSAHSMKKHSTIRASPAVLALSTHTKGSVPSTGTWFQNCCSPSKKMYSPPPALQKKAVVRRKLSHNLQKHTTTYAKESASTRSLPFTVRSHAIRIHTPRQDKVQSSQA